jgi:hypothetical protein
MYINHLTQYLGYNLHSAQIIKHFLLYSENVKYEKYVT